MKGRIFQTLLCVVISGCLFWQNNISINANDSACYLSEEQINICKTMEERYNVSAALLCAIIQQESGGNPEAVNGPCKGLMQVSDFWACADDNLMEPFNNVELGTEVLLYYADQYDGDLYLALAHYHGETNPDVNHPSKYVISIVTTASRIEEEWYGTATN